MEARDRLSTPGNMEETLSLERLFILEVHREQDGRPLRPAFVPRTRRRP